MRVSSIGGLRGSGASLALAVFAWASAASVGCASVPRPAFEPAFAARTYTPVRIALLPPDMFVVLDQVGANDPAASEALRQQVFRQWVDAAVAMFRQRGYAIDLSARWDGIRDATGQILVSRDELAGMASAMLQFTNGPAGALTGPLTVPQFIAPDLAAKIGWATQSDSVLYVNLKGVTTSNGKRAAQVVGVVFFVVVIALIVLALVAEGHGGSHGGSSGGGGNPVPGGSRSVVSAAPVRGGAVGLGARTLPTPGSAGMTGGAAALAGSGSAGGIGRAVAPSGRGGSLPPPTGPRRVYGGGYGGGPRVDVGIGVVIPLDGPVYTHEGSVEHDDEWFGGDQMYFTMTLVNATDGRVLWHLRESLDLDLEDPKDIQALVNRTVGALPLRGDLVDGSATAAAPAAVTAPATAPGARK